MYHLGPGHWSSAELPRAPFPNALVTVCSSLVFQIVWAPESEYERQSLSCFGPCFLPMMKTNLVENLYNCLLPHHNLVTHSYMGNSELHSQKTKKAHVSPIEWKNKPYLKTQQLYNCLLLHMCLVCTLTWEILNLAAKKTKKPETQTWEERRILSLLHGVTCLDYFQFLFQTNKEQIFKMLWVSACRREKLEHRPPLIYAEKHEDLRIK